MTESPPPSPRRPARVLHFLPWTGWGGGVTAMMTLVVEQAKRGPVFVVVVEDGPAAQTMRTAGVTVIPIFAAGKFRSFRPIRVTKTFATLIRSARKHDVDIIHSHSAISMKFCWPASRLSGRPVIAHQRDNYDPTQHWFYLFFGRADHIIAVSRWIKTTLPSRLQEKITALHDGVELPDVTPRPEGPLLQVGVAGGCYPGKGQDLLLTAAASIMRDHPNLRFDVHVWGLGTNAYSQQLQKMVDDLDPALRPHFHLVPYRLDMENFYNAIDIAVVPSRMPDSFPRAVTEAMSHYKAVICAAHGGMIEIIDHVQTGLTFKPDDAADLAVQLRRLLTDPALRQRLKLAARARAEKQVAPGPYCDAVEEVYQRVLQR